MATMSVADLRKAAGYRFASDSLRHVQFMVAVERSHEAEALTSENIRLRGLDSTNTVALHDCHIRVEDLNTRANKAERKLRRKEPWATIGKVAVAAGAFVLGKSAIDYFGLKL